MYLCSENQPVCKKPDIAVVASGKGGVGKSCFAVNAAVEIARKGWRVVLVDADLGCSNVETILGARFDCRLDDFFYQKGRKTLESVVCDSPYQNLRVIPGTSGLLDVANPRHQQKVAFMRELRQLDADLILVDLDAGSHVNTLDLFLVADKSHILVITPEKTSIDNAFKFLRAALFRRIETFYRSREVAVLLKRNETFSDFLEMVGGAAIDEDARETLCEELQGMTHALCPQIVVNKASNPYEAQIAANIFAKYARQYLNIETRYLGYILFDKHVPEAVNCGTPFVVSQPRMKPAACIADITSRLGYL